MQRICKDAKSRLWNRTGTKQSLEWDLVGCFLQGASAEGAVNLSGGDEEFAVVHDLFFTVGDSSQMLKPRPTTSMCVPERGEAPVCSP